MFQTVVAIRQSRCTPNRGPGSSIGTSYVLNDAIFLVVGFLNEKTVVLDGRRSAGGARLGYS